VCVCVVVVEVVVCARVCACVCVCVCVCVWVCVMSVTVTCDHRATVIVACVGYLTSRATPNGGPREIVFHECLSRVVR
jgi:hypothetical protein